MIKCSLDDGKRLMIEILKYIQELCDKNGLEYFIIAGTLLGAVRHKGFIPWDDDIDIMMTKEDRERLIQLIKKDNNERFDVLDNSLDETFPLELTKVIMKGTSCQLVKDLKSVANESEVFVDIFTIDFFDKEVSQKARKYVRLFENARKKSVIDSLSPGMFKNGLKVFRIVSRVLVPINLVKLYKNKYTVKEGRYLGYAVEESSDLICSYDDVYPIKKIEFEGIEVCAPNNSKKVLEKQYGSNYMKLPPEEKRIKHSECIFVNEDIAKIYNIK